MSFCTIQDALMPRVEEKKANMMNIVVEVENLLTSIKNRYWNPLEATFQVTQVWSDTMNVAWGHLAELEKFEVLSPTVAQFNQTIYEELDQLNAHYWSWTEQEIINTKEAAEKFGRSRSTIYRWIKQGKIKAKKVGRRWEIAV